MSKDSSSSQRSVIVRAAKLLGVVGGTLAIFIFSQFIGVILLLGVGYLFGYSPADLESKITDDIYWQFASIALISIIQIRILQIIFTLKKRNLYESILLKRPSLRLFGSAVAISIVYLFTLLAIVTLVDKFIPSVDTDQMQNIGFESPEGVELVVTFVALVVFPPIAEEIIFRGVLYRQSKKYLNSKSAAILTGLIFAAAHLEFLSGGSLNLIAAIDTFLLSLFIIYAYEKYQNLYIAIFIHALKNGLAFMALYILGN